MSIERGINALAGFMVLIALVLSWVLHANFIWLAVFVGLNLLQSAFTGFCPAAFFMRRLGMQTERELAR